MANPLQQLLSLVQGGQPMGAGMAATGPSDMVSETPDIPMQLKALMGGGGGAPMMPQAPQPGPAGGPMLAALLDRMGSAQAGEPYATQNRGGGRPYNAGADNFGRGPATDSDYYDVHEANQSVRGNLPPEETNDYSGYGDEMKPMDEPRQTPYPSEGPGNPKYDQTKSELDDISKRMGSGDPSEDGNFPTQAEIDALNAGKISPAEFDRKWGKGAAAEMQDVGKGNEENDGDEDDPGDHEYR
jgi:hypothetical protein